MFRKGLHNIEESYKMVIESKDEIIVNMKKELDDANTKLNEFQKLEEERKNHICKCNCIPIENTKQYIETKEFMNMYFNKWKKSESNIKSIVFNYKDICDKKQKEIDILLLKLQNNNIPKTINIEENEEYKNLLEERNMYKNSAIESEGKVLKYYQLKSEIDEMKDENIVYKNNIEKLKKKLDDQEQSLYDKLREEIKEEFQSKIDLLEEEKDNIKVGNNLKYNEELNKLNKIIEDNKKYYEDIIEKNKSNTGLPSPSTSTENKNETTKNNFCISDFCKITGYDDVNSDVKEDIMKELLTSIKMYSDIYTKIKNMSNINEIIDWLIKNRHIKHHNEIDKNRYRVINKYKRSYLLYKEFENSLQYVYFSFSKMTRISNKYWEDWVNILKNKIEEEKLKYKTTKNGGDGNFKNLKYKLIKILIINYYKNKCIKLQNNKEKEIKIDKSRKHKIIKNPIKIINTNKYFYEIDFMKYKIGDKIIFKNQRGNEDEIIIQNWCTMCKESPCKYSHDYCKDCNKAINGKAAFFYKGNNNICKNCRNLFERKNISDLYCNNCII